MRPRRTGRDLNNQHFKWSYSSGPKGVLFCVCLPLFGVQVGPSAWPEEQRDALIEDLTRPQGPQPVLFLCSGLRLLEETLRIDCCMWQTPFCSSVPQDIRKSGWVGGRRYFILYVCPLFSCRKTGTIPVFYFPFVEQFCGFLVCSRFCYFACSSPEDFIPCLFFS